MCPERQSEAIPEFIYPRSHVEVRVSVCSKVSGNGAETCTYHVLWIGRDGLDAGKLEPEPRGDTGAAGVLVGINRVTTPLEVQIIERIGKGVHLGWGQNSGVVKRHVVVGPVAVALLKWKTKVRHQVVVVIEVADINPIAISERVIEVVMY